VGRSCNLWILPDGSVVLMVGIQSHGQGLELLEVCLKASEVATIGPIGNYGGKPWISITFDKQRTAVLTQTQSE
jgi:hypothetical protein